MLFLWVCSGESATVLFSPTTANIESEILFYLQQVEAIDYEGREEKIHSKVANCFYLKVPKLVYIMNRRGGKFKIIASSFCKRKLQQDQEKIT